MQMPKHKKYEVGDVAKLFPKPQKSMSKSGKKLQSLFREFHGGERKPFPKNKTIQKEEKIEKEASVPKSSAEGKERKFSLKANLRDLKSNISNVMEQLNVKLQEPEDDVKPKSKKMKKSSLVKEFPRGHKKKLKSNVSNCQIQVKLEEPEEEVIKPKSKKIKSLLIEEFPKRHKKKVKSNVSNCQIQVKLDEPEEEVIKPKSKKIKSSLIEEFPKRHKKKVKSNVSNHQIHVKHKEEEEDIKPTNMKIKKDMPNEVDFPRKRKMKKKVKESVYQTDPKENFTSIQDSESVQSSPAKRKFKPDKIYKSDQPQAKGFIKRAKSKICNDSYSATIDLDNTGLQHRSKIDQLDLDEEVNDSLSFPSATEKKKHKKKKKQKQNDINLNAEQKVSSENHSDFIKLPGIQEKRNHDEEITRTLYVGNLPTNMRKKALIKLFSSFGPVEKVRYTPIETDRNKIFKYGDSKQKMLHKAATSLHGFVLFENRESASDALALNGSMFEDHHITVDFALPPGKRKIYDNKRSIFIGNLPFDVEDENVWNVFGGCGRIEGVRIVRDFETGVGKGFGYVLFTTVEAKQKALEMENIEIKDRPIRVKAIDAKNPKKKRLFERNSNQDRVSHKDPFKSRAIKLKKVRQGTHSKSRKSVNKIIKKNKNIHQKKKIASLLGKAMKL